MFQRALRLFVALTLASSVSFAAPSSKQKSQPAQVVINAVSLKRLMLDRNIDLLVQLNQVQQAKARVNQARGNVLPSINLGTVVASGVSFGLATVSVLLPFLLPSSWFDLRKTQHLLNAQGSAYYIAQLNTYASAYTLYYTVLNDMDLRVALYAQYVSSKNLEDAMKIAMERGIISPEDFLKAQAQTQLAFIQVSQVDALINSEKAAVREMLALPLNTDITFERGHAPASPYENQSPMVLLPQVLKNSPEYSQINSLISAAVDESWSQAFSFLTGSSLTAAKSNGSFGDVGHIGTVNLGFAYFPALQISNLNVAAIKLQKQALEFDHAQILEVTLVSLNEAGKQLVAAELAVNNLQKVYDSQLGRFRLGMISLVELLQTTNSLTTALANRVTAQSSLDNQRIALHRVMLTDQFSTVAPCIIKQRSRRATIKPQDQQATLDKACRG
jgi:outer membrane protein TolC